MDKQQATQHVLTRLRAGYNRDEIAEELSRLLKAPPEAVGPFVDRVAASNPETVPPPRKPDDTAPPGWLQSLSIQTETNQDTQPNQSADSDLPPSLQDLIDQDDTAITPSDFPETPKPQDDPKLVATQEPVLIPASPEKVDEPSEIDESRNVDLKALRESVLTQLKKQRRQNDIVESVCHQTGWHWNKAQRFVARVKTQNHGQIQTRQNTVTIAFGIGIIIVGLIMTLNGASAISDYARLAMYARTNPEVLLSVSPQSFILTVAATITGIGMIIGGGFGIGRALTNR